LKQILQIFYRTEDLDRYPLNAIKLLYRDTGFVSKQVRAAYVNTRSTCPCVSSRYLFLYQDGIRFNSQSSLARHLDYLFKKSSGERTEKRLEHRSWYGTVNVWMEVGGNVDNGDDRGDSSGGAALGEEEDVYVASFDEHFTRCPVSREMFETYWDDEEGGLMFRNAVKVLVTELGDKSVFAVSKPTEVDGVRYCVVHKLLVLDGWVAGGKAVRLSCFEEAGSKEKFVEAAGDDDDEDVFVIRTQRLFV
jgi:hypothetical protein